MTIDQVAVQVTGWIGLSSLLNSDALVQPADLLNGTLYDADQERPFVTGKLRLEVFEIELVEE